MIRLALAISAAALLAAAPVGGRAAAQTGGKARGAKAAAPSSSSPAAPAGKPGAGGAEDNNRKKADPRAKRKRGPARPKAMAGGGPYEITAQGQKGKIIPFPSEATAVTKAFAEHRRTQLADAEHAARDAQQKDRWHSVLFELRDLDSRADPESCFWRVLAYYRLGELRPARQLRESCQFNQHDDVALDAEDVASVALQPGAGRVEVRTTSGEIVEDPRTAAVAAKPIVNDGAYSGPAPARFQ